MKKYIFVLLVLQFILIFLNNCSTRFYIPGYLLLEDIHDDRIKMCINLKNRRTKLYPQLKRIYDKIQGNKFEPDNQLKSVYSIDKIYDKKTKKLKESWVYLYSVDDKKILKNIKFSNYAINDYQVAGNDLFITDNKTIIRYSIENNKSKTIYRTKKYIASFKFFTEQNVLFFELKNNKTKIYEFSKLYRFDLTDNKTTAVDDTNFASYSVDFKKIIYMDKKRNKLKYYDVINNKFIELDIEPYNISGYSCFVADNMIAFFQTDTVKENNTASPVNPCPYLYLYDLEANYKYKLYYRFSPSIFYRLKYTSSDTIYRAF